MADNETSVSHSFLSAYISKYSFVQLKHGHPFIGFKSRCPTISAFGNCLFNSLNKASKAPFCSIVRG